MSVKIILLIIFLFISKKYRNKNFELKPKIIRYNKFKRKNILNKNIEENLMPFISYAKFIKEGNFPKMFHNKSYSSPKVTFIASVFNKEKYLESFISSIQMQDLKKIEVIFIDDFSTDKSGKIINNYIKRDKRINMIKNKKIWALYIQGLLEEI
jgi:cellulose synthase/poly-beta-1,6-N-acetylglucosamine synthase-like glycosyltransferase